MAKIITQNSLFNYEEIEKLGDLERLRLALEGIDDEGLMLTTVERLNGRLDRDYKFEKHFIRGLKKMNLMVTLSLIVMNGMAVGKIKNNISSIRSLVTAA